MTMVDGITLHAPELPADAVWLNTPRPLSMRELRGHVVVLDFWTYCCVNCMHVLPVLDAIEKKHARDPFVVVGVHSAKFETEAHPDRVADAIARYGVHHPVVVDREMQIWNAFAIKSWPTLVVVRPNGTIAAIAPGEPDPDVLESFVTSEIDDARARGQLTKTPIVIGAVDAHEERALSFPSKIDVASDGRIALSDAGHHRVLVLDASGRVIETIGSGFAGWRDGSFDEASLDDPQGVRWHPSGKSIFVADARAHVVGRIDLEARTLVTIAGTGRLGEAPLGFTAKPAKRTALRSPWDLALDGDRLLVAMAGSHQIAVIDLAKDTVVAIAGTGAESRIDGDALHSTWAQPSGLALAGRTLFVADSETSSVRAMDLETSKVRTLVGQGLFDFGDADGPADRARLQHCIGVALGPDGAPVVADTYNDKLRRIDPSTGETKTIFAGQGELKLREPSGLAWDGARDAWLVADTGNARLVEISADGSRARAVDVTGAPFPKRGDVRRREFGLPRYETDWFTAALDVRAPLGEGDANLVITLRPSGALHLAGNSNIGIALDVSRRSDLLVLASTTVRRHVPAMVAELDVTLPLRVETLPVDTIDAELTVCIDSVVCSEGDRDVPSACIPVRTYARVPIPLARVGGHTIALEIPVRRAQSG
jgi:DNA-binding beta-propeller fold protein YncE